MRETTVTMYADMADADRARRAREFIQSDGVHPMTAGWSRYRPHEERVMVRDSAGRERWLTPTQHRVLIVGRTHEGEKVTARIIANSIGVAPSTVSRALTVLASLTLVAYDVVRGRYGGITFLSSAWADMKARARRAWGKRFREREMAWDRYLRKLDKSLYWWSGLSPDVNVASTSTYGRNIEPAT
jgi:hypothetical protein